MRYLVRARLKRGADESLLDAIESERLGKGSVAEGEFVRNMQEARQFPDGTTRWIEVCYCQTPLAEERPYWQEHFELIRVQDAHARHNCRDENGSEIWACGDCDCTRRLQERLNRNGISFLSQLRRRCDRPAS